MKGRSSGGRKVVKDVGGHFLSDKKHTSSRLYTDVAHGFPGDSGSHQGAQNVPVAQRIPLKKTALQADHRTVFRKETVLFQIIRQVDKYFSFGILISAEGIEPRGVAEKKPCHFQLSGRQKPGLAHNIPADAAVNLIPELCQQHTVFRSFCDFINGISLHMIHLYKGYRVEGGNGIIGPWIFGFGKAGFITDYLLLYHRIIPLGRSFSCAGVELCV